jgi:hypothetical protein
LLVDRRCPPADGNRVGIEIAGVGRLINLEGEV